MDSRETLRGRGLFRCSKCPRRHSRTRPNGQPQSMCNRCHAAYMRRTRPKYHELSEEQRRRSNVRSYARVYLARGILQKKPCEGKRAGRRCMRRDVVMHHDDYSKPLVVRWFCVDCHRAHHRAQG